MAAWQPGLLWAWQRKSVYVLLRDNSTLVGLGHWLLGKPWLTSSCRLPSRAPGARLVLCCGVAADMSRFWVVWAEPAAMLAVPGPSLLLTLAGVGSRRLW